MAATNTRVRSTAAVRLAPARIALVLLASLPSVAAPTPSGELAGSVETRSGERLHGTIRWGDDDRFWTDRLDAFRVEETQPFRLSLFGVRLLGPPFTTPRTLSIPWGLVDALALERGAVRIELAGGRTLAAERGELEPAVQIVVDSGARRRVVPLDEIRAVRFDDEGRSVPAANRLAGRVVSVDGVHDGLLTWDRDERLPDETLEGLDASGKRRSIPFSRIREIARIDGQSSELVLDDGRTVRLHGTNDVGPGHRGVVVEGDGWTVAIPWRAIERVQVDAAGTARGPWRIGRDEPLRAVVCTKDGRAFSGEIEWDLDERFTFETLEGRTAAGVEYAIRFDRIEEVAPLDGRSSRVRLRDGRTLELRDRNDVASDHRGLRVNGAERLLWFEVSRVRLAADAAELRRLVEETPCRDR